MTNPTDNQTPQPVDNELYQILDNLVQGVKEIPSKPIADIHDPKAINESMQHYYDQRAKWIDLTVARLLQWGTEQYKKGYIDGGIAEITK